MTKLPVAVVIAVNRFATKNDRWAFREGKLHV